VKILPEDLRREKKFHPKAKVMVHPECLSGVVAMADAVLSTSQMPAMPKRIPIRNLSWVRNTGWSTVLNKIIRIRNFILPANARYAPI